MLDLRGNENAGRCLFGDKVYDQGKVKAIKNIFNNNIYKRMNKPTKYKVLCCIF